MSQEFFLKTARKPNGYKMEKKSVGGSHIEGVLNYSQT